MIELIFALVLALWLVAEQTANRLLNRRHQRCLTNIARLEYDLGLDTASLMAELATKHKEEMARFDFVPPILTRESFQPFMAQSASSAAYSYVQLQEFEFAPGARWSVESPQIQVVLPPGADA